MDHHRRAYTLIELLITIGLIAVLLAILLPALHGTVKSGRQVQCQVALRTIAHDFLVFADDQLYVDRGADRGRRAFRLETFQESQYQIDEFWSWGEGVDRHELPDGYRNDPMRCPEVRGRIQLHRGVPCSQGAVGPRAHVSFGFNLRLHRAERRLPTGPIRLVPVWLTESIRDEGMVPLGWDVDGALADRKGREPVFSGPSLGSRGPFGGDSYWFPSARHLGATNVAFVGGHVLASRNLLGEAGWRWDYQPPGR